MIKIVFLLTLIYFTCCDPLSECLSYNEYPKNAKECISLQAETNRMCCLLEYKCQDKPIITRLCDEEDEDFDVEATSKDLEADHTLECESVKVNIICHEDEVNNSYYLKIGILLILGLLF